MSEQPKDDVNGAAQFFGLVLIGLALFFVFGDCAKFPRDSYTSVRATQKTTGKTPATKR